MRVCVHVRVQLPPPGEARVYGSVLSLLGAFSGRGFYYHWVMEALPRLLIVQVRRCVCVCVCHTVPQDVGGAKTRRRRGCLNAGSHFTPSVYDPHM